MTSTVMMELTWRCGAACRFCYLGGTGRLNPGGAELKTADIKAFMRRFPSGTRFYFTGGEPFLRKDIFEILAYAAARGFNWGVNTSGLPLNGAGVKRLMALGPDYVIFSLHGPAVLHDRLTGRKGAYKKLLSVLGAAVKHRRPGSEVMVNCVINPSNAALLPAVYLAAARAGADRAVFEHLQFITEAESAGLGASGIMTPLLKACRLDVSALQGSIKKIKSLRGAFDTHFELRPDFSGRELERYYNGRMRPSGKCPGLLSTINVEPDGKVRTCVLYCPHVTDVKKYSQAALRKAKLVLTSGGLPRGCARCCHRFAIKRVF